MHQKMSPEELRSYRWYGVRDLRSFGHRSRTKQSGGLEEKRASLIHSSAWKDDSPKFAMVLCLKVKTGARAPLSYAR